MVMLAFQRFRLLSQESIAVAKNERPKKIRPSRKRKRRFSALLALNRRLRFRLGRTSSINQASRGFLLVKPRQALAAHRLPQLDESAGLDLPDALACDAVGLGDLVQRP